MFKTRKQVSVSGKETALADWSAPRYRWDLTYTLLRQGSFQASTWSEFATLMGFYDQMKGGFDTFLYQDQDDYTVTGQGIAIGNGSQLYFPLIKSFGGYAEQVLAPNVVTAVYFNGVAQTVGSVWNWCTWGGTAGNGGGAVTWTTAGYLYFGTAPANGVVITADFSYYYPCRFVDDQCEFEKFQAGCYAVKKMSFMSVK
jgi:uncharacterized protein (TIGR02217 family)